MSQDFILPNDERTSVEAVDTLFLAVSSLGKGADDPACIPCPPDTMKLYGEPDDWHLYSGRDQHSTICNALARGGKPIESVRRVLEFGCSNSRILRWFLPYTKVGVEVWGTDIDAKRLLWSDHVFGSDIHYTLNTASPLLPFPRSHFDVIYAGSVFTHIDGYYLSWLAELRRILTPDGLAWITINDEVTADILMDLQGNYFVDTMRAGTKFNCYQKTDWVRFAVGLGVNRNVFYRRSWLIARLAPLFEVVDVEERAYADFQTALLLRRRDE